MSVEKRTKKNPNFYFYFQSRRANFSLATLFSGSFSLYHSLKVSSLSLCFNFGVLIVFMVAEKTWESGSRNSCFPLILLVTNHGIGRS